MAPRLREVIASVPEVRGVMSHVGRPDDGTNVTSFFNLEFDAPIEADGKVAPKPVTVFGNELWERGITREEIQGELMAKFKAFPGINFNFSQYIRDNVEEALSGVKGANSIKLRGNDLDDLEKVGERVVTIFERSPGVVNAGAVSHRRPTQPRDPDRPHKCARNGINRERGNGGPGRHGLAGFHPNGRRGKALRYRVPTARKPRNDPKVIGRIPVDSPGQGDNKPGDRIPSSQLDKIDPHKPGTKYIYRENNRRYIPIKFSVPGARPGLGHRRSEGKVNDPRTGLPSPRRDIGSSGQASSSRCRKPTLDSCGSFPSRWA